jgi:hypothetical protein
MIDDIVLPNSHDDTPRTLTDATAQERWSPSAGSTGRRIEDLPKEVGVMLVSVGALGVVLPAMAGAPALVAGGLVLWPRTFGRFERWFERRYPGTYQHGMRQIGRYLDDLERRFPESTRR